MAEKLYQQTAGKVTTAVFRYQAPTPSAAFFDLYVDVAADMVAVGGGAIGAEGPQGALLTASYPSPSRSGWHVSSKDHLNSNPHQLTGFAIGMKVDGVSRNDLLQELAFVQVTSGVAAHPTATAVVPDGFILLGGGFRVNWQPGTGNLATASFPEFGELWTARSKDHYNSSPCTIDTFAIGIRTPLFGLWQVRRSEATNDSGTANHPSATVGLPNGFALTGIGAEVKFTEPGSLLWKLDPSVNGAVTASSKDHFKASPARIRVSTISIAI